MNVGERIKIRRKELGFNADYVADKLGISRSTIFRYEKGEIEKLPTQVLEDIAVILQTSPAYLMGWEETLDISAIYNQLEKPRQQKVYNFAERQLEKQNETKIVHIYGKTAAGAPLTYGDDVIEEREVKYVPKHAECALVVQGDSMEPEIKDGSIVFYKQQENVENGEIAIVEVDGDGVTCKRVKFDFDNDKVVLQSLNDKYEDVVLNGNQVRIIGKVVK